MITKYKIIFICTGSRTFKNHDFCLASWNFKIVFVGCITKVQIFLFVNHLPVDLCANKQSIYCNSVNFIINNEDTFFIVFFLFVPIVLVRTWQQFKLSKMITILPVYDAYLYTYTRITGSRMWHTNMVSTSDTRCVVLITCLVLWNCCITQDIGTLMTSLCHTERKRLWRIQRNNNESTTDVKVWRLRNCGGYTAAANRAFLSEIYKTNWNYVSTSDEIYFMTDRISSDAVKQGLYIFTFYYSFQHGYKSHKVMEKNFDGYSKG